MMQLKEELNLETLCGEAYLGNKVRSIIVGAMEPQNMISYLKDGSLVVVPGDRVDNVVISVNTHLLSRSGGGPRVAGILLTGGLIPHLSIINMLSQVDVPVLLAEEDTATAAYQARELVAKITPRDTDKLALAEKLVKEHVDLESIFAGSASG